MELLRFSNLGLGGIGRALGSRNYRIYWIGSVVSVLGTWINKLALGWLTWQLTESAAWLGTIVFSAMVPTMLLAPIAGAVADRIGRRRTVMTAMFLGGTNIMVIAAMVMADAMTIERLMVLAVFQGVFLAFDFPVRHALVPVLVERRDISPAIALNSTTFFAGSFIGPAIGGVVISTLGIGPAFALNGLTFYIFLLLFTRIRLEWKRPSGGGLADIGGDLAAGFRYAFGHKSVRLVLFIAITGAFLLRPYIDLLPGFAAQVFARGPEGLAMLTSAGGLGGLLTGLWLAVRGRTQGLTRIFLMSTAAGATLLFLFSLTEIFWLALVILFCVGMALVSGAVCSQSLIQNTIDDAMRARVVSITVSVAIGGPATGALVLGTAAEKVGGLGPPVSVASAVSLLIILFVAPKLFRRQGELEIETAGPLR